MKLYIRLMSIIAFSILLSGCAISSYEAGSDLQVAKRFVAGGNVNSGSPTALYYAAQYGKIDVAKYLLSNGADINAGAGQTWLGAPLNAASFNGKLDMAKLLIEKGADVDARSMNKETSLHLASFKGHKEIVELLVEKGANIDLQTFSGSTALSLSTAFNRNDTAKYLIEKGADVSIKDNAGQVALDHAKEGTELRAMLDDASNPMAKVFKQEFAKAKEKNSILAYESFIASYPDAPQVSSARDVIAAKKEANKNNPELQKKILNTILSYLKKKDISGLMKYANANPEVIDFAQTQEGIGLLFSGPKELQVGKLLQYKKQGLSDGMLSSKIKSLNKPYKKFSLDEMQSLMDFGLSEKLVMTMLDVTTAYEKEHRQLQAQQDMLKAQEKIAKENKNTTTTVYQNSQPTQTVQQESGIGDKIVEKVAEKALEGLIRNLF